MARVMTTKGQEMLASIPPVLREDPDRQAVLTCYAREAERMDDAMQQVIAQFFPQTADVLLGVWEALLRTSIEPSSKTLAERRDIVIALARKLKSSPSGRDWEATVTALVGPGWSYQEHDPADPTTPPPYTLRLVLPFPPGTPGYMQAEALLRDITPAHLDLVLTFAGGFILDHSQLDQETLHY